MQTKVIITIDTEVRSRNRDLPDPFDRDVLGRLQGNNYGACWIADLIKNHGFTGVFFLDVHGCAKYGENRYRELCERLLNGGHSVQLHTHPDQMYDPQRRHMHEYSLAEQKAIIREGMVLLKDWTGKVPLAHRAGRYGANEDTLKALETNGIYLDSSFFYGRADCKLPFGNSNDPFKAHGVWEVPVTVAAEPITKLGFRFPFWTRLLWKRYQKLDVNCMDAKQLCRSVMEVYGKVPYLITFLHSFSFVQRRPTGFVTDDAAIEAFQSLLRLLAEKNIPVTTLDKIAGELVGNP
ncbi:MAG: hypothetical protein DME19_07715 [Verrucomicrobia bacterium]|nr:MAG: hypothetical protein DME19_07715 [Verrucomicrobiota bacterium]